MTEYGVDRMAAKTGNGKIKKTSRGMRKHVRRMKQESRKTGIPLSEWKKKVRSQPIPKKAA
jgi:predicted RNA-binding protein with PIN domain